MPHHRCSQEKTTVCGAGRRHLVLGWLFYPENVVFVEGDFLRIVPWAKSPFFTTLWDMFSFFHHQASKSKENDVKQTLIRLPERKQRCKQIATFHTKIPVNEQLVDGGPA